MRRALSLLLPLGLCWGIAQAGIWEGGNPPGLHVQRLSTAVQLRGWVSQVRLTDRRGRATTVGLARPYRLEEALPLPPGDWADLTLLLDAPAWVHLAAGPPSRLAVPEITVPLDDPSATLVRLDWALPDPLVNALREGQSVPSLAAALSDAGIARATP